MTYDMNTVRSLLLANLAARGITYIPQKDGVDWVDDWVTAIAATIESVMAAAIVQTTSGAPDGEHTGVLQ